MAAPTLLCDTKGMSRERWLEVRAHGPNGSIPIAFGGSDISVIFGVNPWKTPLELWLEKAGKTVPSDSGNKGQKKFGHLMEPVVAEMFGDETGFTVIEDTGLYQHSKYPFALANLDYRVQIPDGRTGVLECKTTSYRNAHEWDDDSIPLHYELQCRWYMAIMDVDFCYIVCLWGNNSESDMAIRLVERDLAMEEMIIAEVAKFIKSIRENRPPTMNGIPSELAIKACARILQKSDKNLPTIEFGPAQERSLRRIAALQKENANLKKLAEKNEKEAEALSVQIMEAMKEHEHGILNLSGEQFLVDFVPRITRRPDSWRLKFEYPQVYADVLKSTVSRKVKVASKINTGTP